MKLSEIIRFAADYILKSDALDTKLSEYPHCKSSYSCIAVYDAINVLRRDGLLKYPNRYRYKIDRLFDMVKVNWQPLFDDEVTGEHCNAKTQSERYIWLQFVALFAEDIGE